MNMAQIAPTGVSTLLNSTQARAAVRIANLIVILSIAGTLRFGELGKLSYWYDEVVTVRLARTAGPMALLQLLGEIDATRAPLHPLILQAWLSLFGPSEYSARALSALCGLATVGIIYVIGQSAFDTRTGTWGAWLAASSPALVQYSREARMYSWLVLVTCIAWATLLSLRKSISGWKQILLGATLIALVYSHPLGLLVVATLGLAYWANRAAFQLPLRNWLLIHLVFVMAAAPWLVQYLNHEPEWSPGRLPVRYLIGLPIGFVGGDRYTLAVCGLVIVCGAITVSWNPARARLDQPISVSLLLIWFVVPAIMLYAYSQIGRYAIFGPTRYTLFVAPAYLLLLARGLGKLRWWVRWPLAALLAFHAVQLLQASVLVHDLKADWRSVAAQAARSDRHTSLLVVSVDPKHNVEVETARYYLGRESDILPAESAVGLLKKRGPLPRTICVAIGTRGNKLSTSVPVNVIDNWPILVRKKDYHGLQIIWRAQSP
jgi:uncharacterized membrane protein